MHHQQYHLINLACQVIDELLDNLGIEYKAFRKLYAGPCPVHGGDNPMGLNLYPDGDDVKGYWRCNTHHCEKKWGCSLLGLVRGVLSNKEHRTVTYTEAGNYVAKFLGYENINGIPKPSQEQLDRLNYNRISRSLNLLPEQSGGIWRRDVVRSMIQVPSSYYLNRGYSKDILDRYDVGYYHKTGRVAVPMYEDTYKFAVGFSARSIHPKCPKCGFWHSEKEICPNTPSAYLECSKWKNSKGFSTAHYLYNFWFAKKHIEKTNVIILTEGPGDVWRLEENGIHNSVALFGTSLTLQQRVILDQSGAMSAIILLDNDKAGKTAALELKQQLGRSYRLYFPAFNGNDVGDLNSDDITKDVRPIISKVMECAKIE